MARYHAALSADGYVYDKENGLVRGLHTYGVIRPESNVRNAHDGQVRDAIVIGAGYSGLIAARDLVKAGTYARKRGTEGDVLTPSRRPHHPARSTRSHRRPHLECRD